jgi:hypothetical protein
MAGWSHVAEPLVEARGQHLRVHLEVCYDGLDASDVAHRVVETRVEFGEQGVVLGNLALEVG